ncbi:MAG: hypothetical protein KH050_05920 [Clostridiaceae bacterium]|nr:hypothetical protein [Clostridiaceae bacterium]
MQGSKYDDETRERALAMCAMPKMNPAKVAAAMGIPRATVYDWQKTAQETDPDFAAVRRNKIRAMMDKSYAVVGRAIDGLEKRSKAVKLESAEIDRILLKLAADEGLDDTTRKAITAIIRDYTGASMTDLMRVAKDGFAISETLERKLMGEDNGAHDVHVQLTLVDPKGD